MLLQRKGYDQPRQCIIKQRHYFAYKGLYSQSYGFPSCHVWMWELDNKKGWVPKNWCFWAVVLEKTLKTPLDWKEISPEYSLERLILKLKLQYFGHLMWTTDSQEKTLMLGNIEGRGGGYNRGWDGWMTSSTQWLWVGKSSGSWWWSGRPCLLQSMGWQKVGHDWVTELIWTDPNWIEKLICEPASQFSMLWLIE